MQRSTRDAMKVVSSLVLHPMAAPERSTDEKVDWIARLGEIRSEFRYSDFMHVLETNAATWAQEISVGPFWTAAAERLSQWRTEYTSVVGSSLLPMPGLPIFQGKSESSIRDKLIRLCEGDSENLIKVVPLVGPPIPKMHDLVRTRVICSYIDGVEFLANKFREMGKEFGCNPVLSREGRVEGYFAQHLTLNQDVIYREAGHTQMTIIECEIQFATELATQLWKSSHRWYEDARGRINNAPEEWQWKPDDPRFIANQLGHMIHLADGLLIQLRDREKNHFRNK